MGLVELMSSTAGGVPQPEQPVVISCDWNTLPTDDRLGAIVELINVARFQARFIDAKEAYVLLKNVSDRRTPEDFRDAILDAYTQRERYQREK